MIFFSVTTHYGPLLLINILYLSVFKTFLFDYNLLLNAMTQVNLHYLLSKLLFLYKGTTIILCSLLRCRRPTSTLTFNNSVSLMGTLVSFLCLFFCSLLFCFVILCFALLPRVSTYLAPLHFHFVRISFNFPAMSHSMDIFFLQSACADSIKKRVVGAATVDNDFWSCFIEKIYATIVFVSTFSYVSSFYYLEALLVEENEACLIYLSG